MHQVNVIHANKLAKSLGFNTQKGNLITHLGPSLVSSILMTAFEVPCPSRGKLGQTVIAFLTYIHLIFFLPPPDRTLSVSFYTPLLHA